MPFGGTTSQFLACVAARDFVVALVLKSRRRACRYEARLSLCFECRKALDMFNVPLGTLIPKSRLLLRRSFVFCTQQHVYFLFFLRGTAQCCS